MVIFISMQFFGCEKTQHFYTALMNYRNLRINIILTDIEKMKNKTFRKDMQWIFKY